MSISKSYERYDKVDIFSKNPRTCNDAGRKNRIYVTHDLGKSFTYSIISLFRISLNWLTTHAALQSITFPPPSIHNLLSKLITWSFRRISTCFSQEIYSIKLNETIKLQGFTKSSIKVQ